MLLTDVPVYHQKLLVSQTHTPLTDRQASYWAKFLCTEVIVWVPIFYKAFSVSICVYIYNNNICKYISESITQIQETYCNILAMLIVCR